MAENTAMGPYASIVDLDTLLQTTRDIRIQQEEAQKRTLLATDIIAPIGLILNFVFLFVVIRVKSMRTIINVYLSNLAVADSLFLLVAFITSFLSPLDAQTHALLPITLVLLLHSGRFASCCFVTAIAVDRFSAVHHPIAFRASASKARAAKISAGLWVLSAGFGVTMTLLAHSWCLTNYVKVFVTCLKVGIILLVIFYAAIFIVNAAMYIYILIKLLKISFQLMHTINFALFQLNSIARFESLLIDVKSNIS